MCEWDGWMCEWMNAWMDGWMDPALYPLKDKENEGRKEGRMCEWDGWMSGTTSGKNDTLTQLTHTLQQLVISFLHQKGWVLHGQMMDALTEGGCFSWIAVYALTFTSVGSQFVGTVRSFFTFHFSF